MHENSTTMVSIHKHSLMKSTVLHLLPGVLAVLFYTITAPFVMKLRFPNSFSYILAIYFVIIPFMLGHLFYQGKKRNGRFSLKGIVLYREKIPSCQYVIIIPILIVWAVFCGSVVNSVLNNVILRNVFFWLPNWFVISTTEMPQFTFIFVIITWVIALVAVVLNGIVEELYFRGYLLPRINHLRGWAPFINVALFSIYHFFTPWAIPGRIITGLPMVYAVWWKKNIYLSIAVHIAMNIFGIVMMLLVYLK